MSPRVFVVCVALSGFALGCASPRKPDTKAPARVSDSVPERSAALRSAAGLDLEADDQRWGTDTAKDRKRQAREAELASATSQVIPLPPMDGGPPVEAGHGNNN